MPAWPEWGDQQPRQKPAQQAQQPPQQAPGGPPPPPMTMAYGQQNQMSTQPAPMPPGMPQPQVGGQQPPNAVNQWNQAYQQFSGNQDWKDTEQYTPQQWEAWNQQEAQLRSQGKGASNCPPNLPFTGRNGQCAAKPDDCPDGMHVEGSDTNGSARCVPNGQGQQGPGFGGGGGFGQQQGQGMQPNQNKLLGDTYAPQLGYYGQLGSQQGGFNMQALGPIIQSLLGIQLG